MREYNDKDGVEKYAADIRVDQMQTVALDHGHDTLQIDNNDIDLPLTSFLWTTASTRCRSTSASSNDRQLITDKAMQDARPRQQGRHPHLRGRRQVDAEGYQEFFNYEDDDLCDRIPGLWPGGQAVNCEAK